MNVPPVAGIWPFPARVFGMMRQSLLSCILCMMTHCAQARSSKNSNMYIADEQYWYQFNEQLNKSNHLAYTGNKATFYTVCIYMFIYHPSFLLARGEDISALIN